MKIMMVIKGLHQAVGGAENVFCEIATYLNSKHTVISLTSDAIGQEPFYPFPPKIERISMGIGDPHEPSNAIVLIRRTIELRKKIIQYKPDVVLAFMHSSFIPVSLALVGSGIPVIACEHTSIEHYKNRPIERLLYWIALPFLRHITIPMESVRAEYPASIRKKMTVISNPVNTKSQSFVPFFQRKKRIISIGRFDESKGHQVLLEAFASIADENPQWDLRILGDGPLRPRLLHRVKELKLESRVAMPGITHPVEPELQKAQIFALASRYESFGIVLVEAMSAGIPCVAFADCPGVNSLIQNSKTGLLASGPMTPETLAASLRNLIKNDEFRKKLGESAKDDVLEKFNIKTIGARLEKLIYESTRKEK
ncbi:hypothetical protein TH25_01485 [Thalassospira profundimaris]|uniref:Glycosyl transferase family 1 n=1 Tax=Thalassospira profundimaris TaxID=502049 RepID=A0A367XK62_9PROT|nr:glycosyltransferase family 4 protein [Thalassospira profundimaris]RCK54046.1 hypothetical protein TH25_01485 [Thalassospira profundimaris]